MSTPRDTSTITLDSTTIEYTVRRSARATRPRIDVGLAGTEVVLPESSTRDPTALLSAKADWLLEKHAEYEPRRERIPDRTFVEGEAFPFLDEPREVVVESRRDHRLTDDAVRLRRSAVERSSIRAALESVYRREARAYFTDRLDVLADRMGVDYERVEIRNQRTRWGSCSTRGTLSLNWRVVMAPPPIVDYLLVHELAHRREPHHGEAFWALVERYDPDYRAHRDWLDEHGVELVFTEDDL